MKHTFDTGAAIEFDLGLPPEYIGQQPLFCEACGENEVESFYDNGIFGAKGYLCSECIAQAEMEL